MALKSIHNRRGFFSDYWLGTLASARGRDAARLTAAQARKLLDRLRRLTESINGTDPPDLTRFRERFARPVLEDLLGFALREHADEPRLRPLAATPEPDAEPVAAVHLLPEVSALDAPRARRDLESALDQWNLDYGFLLTPEVLRLIRRPGLGARGAALDVHLATLVEQDDLDSLQVLHRLLAAPNFMRGDGGTRPIDRLEADSRRHSAKVSNDLKQAVFDAAERIVGGFLADVRTRPDAFAPPPSLAALRDTGFLALYRLLFILYAEARDERLISHAFYQQHYSLDSLVTKLLRAPVDTWPANRSGLWAHLLALFRIFNEGIAPHLPELENIPPRGGHLFSDETPEGRLLRRLRLDDRSTARVLLALATTRPRRGVGRERVSFRELDIEQLGNVYQGLLEYEPAEAAEVMIECRVQGRDFVLAPADLIRLADTKSLVVKGDAALVGGTEAARLHPDVAAADDEGDTEDEAALEEETIEEGSEDEEDEADTGLTRGATLTLLRRLEAGDFFFKPGSARKASGSYYTPTPIVEYLVRETLAPLVAGKSAAEIERLRVIDLACGSAHFLVGAARFLGACLFDAYRREGHGDPPPAFYPDRSLTAEVRARWDDEGRAWCKRRIVEHCLYGVDLNPAAVQLAQVALWIESLAGDRPLSFFAHHIRCGNSLLGSSLANFDQPPHPKLGKASDRRTLGLFEAELKKRLATALEERKLIDAPLPPEVRADTPEEFAYKEDRLRRAEEATKTARLLLDLRSAAAFVPAIWASFPTLMSSGNLEADAKACPWWDEFQRIRERERFFHWELEFPEVVAATSSLPRVAGEGQGGGGGFDCVLGNPPWEKIKPDRKEFYGRADVLIRAYTGGELDARIRELEQLHSDLSDEFDHYADRLKTMAACLKSGDYHYVDWEINGRSTGGDPDLFKFFVERAQQVLKPGGRLGYLVPSALYNNEGCTGLRHLLLDTMQIERFYGFENRHKIFAIDSRYKFVCLVAKKQAAGTANDFRATFMRHDLDELESGPPAGVEVLIRRSELERLSPGTLAFLEYRSERDRELVLKMYGLWPGQTPRPLLGDQGPGAWHVRFSTEFHMTNDRELWTKRDGTLYRPKDVCGLDWPADRSIPFAEVRAAMAEQGFWPLYEGKHIEQFLVDIKPIERWVNLEAAEKKYGKQPSEARKLVFRDIARNTDARTCIAAVLGRGSCVNNKLPVVETTTLDLNVACAVLNSFAFDFLLRFRVSSTINFIHISRVAVPPVADCWAIPAIPTVSAGSADPPEHDEQYFAAVWQANRAVAQAYGLTADDLAHILSTFPVFARKRPAFYAYLLARVKEWKEETSTVGRRRYAPRDVERSLPQAAEGVTTYGKRPETAQDS
ncbi:MAG: N-6 DNA methylase [Nitrospira sp.]|nr:N-6 DNA methylase [Nitrospira sp.]